MPSLTTDMTLLKDFASVTDVSAFDDIMGRVRGAGSLLAALAPETTDSHLLSTDKLFCLSWIYGHHLWMTAENRPKGIYTLNETKREAPTAAVAWLIEQGYITFTPATRGTSRGDVTPEGQNALEEAIRYWYPSAWSEGVIVNEIEGDYLRQIRTCFAAKPTVYQYHEEFGDMVRHFFTYAQSHALALAIQESFGGTLMGQEWEQDKPLYRSKAPRIDKLKSIRYHKLEDAPGLVFVRLDDGRDIGFDKNFRASRTAKPITWQQLDCWMVRENLPAAQLGAARDYLRQHPHFV